MKEKLALTKSDKIKISLRWTVLILGIVFVVLGILREEHLIVFRKAINICLECIGIG